MSIFVFAHEYPNDICAKLRKSYINGQKIEKYSKSNRVNEFQDCELIIIKTEFKYMGNREYPII